MEALTCLFEPRSVAVIGASGDPSKYGHRVMESILDAGYKGPVYPVNPNLSEVLGRRTYPSIRDLPETVELAFVVIPARAVLDAVRDCIAAGVKGIVVITAGFSEVGEEGREAEREIARLCNEAGIPAVGPNCMGVVHDDGPPPGRAWRCLVHIPERDLRHQYAQPGLNGGRRFQQVRQHRQ